MNTVGHCYGLLEEFYLRLFRTKTATGLNIELRH